MATKVELRCSSCSKEVLGRGVVLINDQPMSVRQPWSEEYANYFPNGIEYMTLHPICFDDVWQAAMQTESNLAVTLCYGTVGDLVRGLHEDEEGEEDG